jgi:PAS domain S-box-containing protein
MMLELSDGGFRRRMLGAAFIAVAAPPLVGGTLMGLVGYYPLPDAYRAAFSYAGLYVLACAVLALWWVARLASRLVSLTRLPVDDAARLLQRIMRPMPLYLLAALTLYSIGGVFAVDASLVALGVQLSDAAPERLSRLVGAAIPVLATALPLFFLINVALDRYFAPRRIIQVVTSLHVKLLVSALVAPLLVDIVLLAYFTNSEGAVDPRALCIWGILLVFVVAGFLFGRADLTRVLSPLQGLTAGPLALARTRQLLQPRSLDELGVVMSRLLERIGEEEALRADVDRLNERLIQVVHATGLGVFDHDLRSDSLYWAEEVWRILGLPPGEPARVGTYLATIHPDDRQQADIAFAQARDPAGSHRYDLEHRILRRDGTVRWVSLHSQTFFAEEEGICRPVRVVGAMIDITDRVEVEARRRALETELQEARRLETIGTFASGIAHDFNNILTIIHGNLAGARAALPRDHAGQRHLDMIALAAQRGADLSGQVSLFARGQRQELRPTPIAKVVQEAVSLVRSGAPGNASIALEILHHDLEVLSSPGQLQQVVCNLATNAVQALGPDGGSVHVLLRGAQLPDAMQPAPQSCQPGTWAVLVVTDTGSGMTQDMLGRIFEPFFTTRSLGTGLGLAVVDRIVRSLHGTVVARSTPGQGSTFEVWLPARTCHVPRAARARTCPGVAAPADGMTRPARVLIVDDDLLVLATISMQIERAGFAVTAASNGAAALQLCGEARPDIALVDFRLPDVSGVELIRRLRASVDLSCVLLTGMDDPSIAALAHAAGATAVLCKPVDPARLQQILESLLRGRIHAPQGCSGNNS